MTPIFFLVPTRATTLLGCVLGPASADIRRGAEAASFLKPIPAAWGERQEPVVIRLHHQKSLLVHRPVSSFGIALRTDWRVQGESHLGSVATKRLPSFLGRVEPLLGRSSRQRVRRHDDPGRFADPVAGGPVEAKVGSHLMNDLPVECSSGLPNLVESPPPSLWILHELHAGGA